MSQRGIFGPIEYSGLRERDDVSQILTIKRAQDQNRRCRFRQSFVVSGKPFSFPTNPSNFRLGFVVSEIILTRMPNLLIINVKEYHKKTTKTGKHMLVVFFDKARMFVIYF